MAGRHLGWVLRGRGVMALWTDGPEVSNRRKSPPLCSSMAGWKHGKDRVGCGETSFGFQIGLISLFLLLASGTIGEV